MPTGNREDMIDQVNEVCDESLEVLFVLPPFFKFMKETFSVFPSGLGSMVARLKEKHISAGIYNADIYPRSGLSRFFKRLKGLFEYRFYNLALKWPLLYAKINDSDDNTWREARIVLEKTKPKIVGITCSVVTIPTTLIFAIVVKEVLPNATVVVGGPAATTCSEHLISSDAVDVLVVGEGEDTITELCEYLFAEQHDPSGLGRIKGIIYKSLGGMVVTEPRPLIAEIDDIPFPDREAMFIYDDGKIRPLLANADILSSRGCPYPCKFCACYKVWGTRKPRVRSVDNVISELKWQIATYGQKNFIFWDDLFTVDRKRVIDFCSKIIADKLEIQWLCLARLNTIDAEMLALMKKAGCVEIQVGIESGNDRVLKHIGKMLTLEMIREKVSIISRSGLDWSIFLIIGFPTETKQEILDTLDLVTEISPTNVFMSIFSPYPGTPFYDDLAEKGLLGKDVIKSDVWYTGNNYTGTMGNEEFSALALHALKLCDKYNVNIARRGKRLLKKWVYKLRQSLWGKA